MCIRDSTHTHTHRDSPGAVDAEDDPVRVTDSGVVTSASMEEAPKPNMDLKWTARVTAVKTPSHYQAASYDRQTLTSPSDSVLSLIGIYHALFLSDPGHCPTVKSILSVCSHSN